MPVTRRACPTCHHSLCLTQELPARVKCVHCGSSFIAAAAEPAVAPARRNGAYPVAAPFAPPPAAPESPPRPAPPWLLGAVLGGAALFVLLGVVLLLFCLAGTDPEPEGRPPTPTPTPDIIRKQPDPPEWELLPPPAEETPPDEIVKSDGPPPLTIKVIETLTKEKVTKPRSLRLAVSPPKYDNMGQLLDSLGAGYQWDPITEDELRSSKRLAEFDVVFFTCASTPVRDPDLERSLRAFVENGGTLYASDLRFAALRGAFPEFIARTTDPDGLAQEVRARVVDGGLREALGAEEIKLKFDAYGWKPASFDRARVTTFLEGWYRTVKGKGDKAFTPLLVRFACGKGTVIFTSFHNSKQNSETERKLLRYLVFTAVTAEIERKVETTMITGGFAPAAARRLATSPDDPQVTQTYTNKRAGPLRFALGFANQGAKLRLTLKAPDGREIEQEGEATFTIEVANAPAGEWRYTVTAVRLPFPNFPFTLTVGAPSK
jgi:hypothetical protein